MSSEWAAWVQAVGSVLAIGVSIAFWRIDANERRWRDRMAQAALASYIRLSVDEVIRFLESLTDDTGRQNEFGGFRGRHQHLAMFNIAKRLRKARAQTDSLGDLGPALHGFLVDLGAIRSISRALSYSVNNGKSIEYREELFKVVGSALKRGAALRMEIDRSIRIVSHR